MATGWLYWILSVVLATVWYVTKQHCHTKFQFNIVLHGRTYLCNKLLYHMCMFYIISYINISKHICHICISNLTPFIFLLKTISLRNRDNLSTLFQLLTAARFGLDLAAYKPVKVVVDSVYSVLLNGMFPGHYKDIEVTTLISSHVCWYTGPYSSSDLIVALDLQ